ncbi:hypothetical protein Q053_05451 [Pseudomonas aeruginosa BWHPSA048]|nr:hypothetical protein Q053_05451 [Pseudomonas aeruginosa BWHPSA048]
MRPLLFSALLLLSGHTQASEWNDSQAVDKLFGAAGVKGTFVLYDVQRQRYVGHDRERAETRFHLQGGEQPDRLIHRGG